MLKPEGWRKCCQGDKKQDSGWKQHRERAVQTRNSRVLREAGMCGDETGVRPETAFLSSRWCC